ncbi:MAG TPA: protein arginine kinase [Metalysinibacillus jejuensis]|uniref:Protein-arginine kinase n=1 Tax=Metalysinibacillus jejuensis TaxID=914327 RepID=A0A921NAD2_9BACL|nr:protein arginine kinase [Metalysinibacillus jejuensis]HJH10344.1 protein arginine kinase [Metalysinibacillus jejuensis]
MANIDDFLQQMRDCDIALADATPNSVAMSTRIRLARNLDGYRFPPYLTEGEEMEVENAIAHTLLDFDSSLTYFSLADIPLLARQVLVEKHLISPQFLQQQQGALIVSADEKTSVMVNEEDHLRIQCLAPGLQLKETYERAFALDRKIEQEHNYMYHQQYGYLTSCPTNLGTGLRASVMLHLPALTMTNRINVIIQAMLRLGMVVRGIYGEGSTSLGNIYQISNQETLGKSEQQILTDLQQQVEQIIEYELRARKALMQQSAVLLEDQIQRALGTLRYARVMTSEEAAKSLSSVRLGIDLGIIQDVPIKAVNDCISCMQPGFLQYYKNETLQTQERDIARAKLIRDLLTNV